MDLGRTQNAREARQRLLDMVRAERTDFVARVAAEFGISRQAVHKHLRWLIEHELLTASGSTRARIYRLGPVRFFEAIYNVDKIEEHTVHRRDFSFIFEGLPDNIKDICHYGFTEIVNNAIDHSGGENVLIAAQRDKWSVSIEVTDDGEGIFDHIARLMDLVDPRESLLELSKGKLTTDPEHHTGEGIFFTSRAFDSFYIWSGNLEFSHSCEQPNDQLLHLDTCDEGTTYVRMEIELEAKRTLGEVFDQFSSGPDDYRFERTVVPVRLAIYEGERLISRSQAKRLLNRIERFRHVVLDFDEVTSIGQAFADEVFRVFQRRHPEIELMPKNMSADVEKMVRRARSHTH